MAKNHGGAYPLDGDAQVDEGTNLELAKSNKEINSIEVTGAASVANEQIHTLLEGSNDEELRARLKENLNASFVGEFDEDGLAVGQLNQGTAYDKFFIVKRDGTVLNNEYYDWAPHFTEGLAEVSQNHKWFFINKEGKQAFPGTFDRAGSFKEGIAIVERGDKQIFINKEGEQAVPGQYNIAHEFSEGLAVVAIAKENEGHKWFFINKEGMPAFPAVFSHADDFKANGYARVYNKGRSFFINKKGEELKYKERQLSEGLRLVSTPEGKSLYLNEEYEPVSNGVYLDAKPYSEGLAAVLREGEWKLSAGEAPSKEPDKWIFIDKNGDPVS